MQCVSVRQSNISPHDVICLPSVSVSESAATTYPGNSVLLLAACCSASSNVVTSVLTTTLSVKVTTTLPAVNSSISAGHSQMLNNWNGNKIFF